jgi:PadR family transcriptional regulator PadR
MRKTNPSFVNGVPELIVLQLLGRREMYGYEIVKAIQAASKDVFAFGEGSIYPILHELQAKKFVKSRRAEFQGRSRFYYTLTGPGKKRLGLLTRQWEQVAAGMNHVLGGAHA